MDREVREIGEVSKWLTEPVSKTGRAARPSWVRIPPSPFRRRQESWCEATQFDSARVGGMRRPSARCARHFAAALMAAASGATRSHSEVRLADDQAWVPPRGFVWRSQTCGAGEGSADACEGVSPGATPDASLCEAKRLGERKTPHPEAATVGVARHVVSSGETMYLLREQMRSTYWGDLASPTGRADPQKCCYTLLQHSAGQSVT